jgi:hypothetical protein
MVSSVSTLVEVVEPSRVLITFERKGRLSKTQGVINAGDKTMLTAVVTTATGGSNILSASWAVRGKGEVGTGQQLSLTGADGTPVPLTAVDHQLSPAPNTPGLHFHIPLVLPGNFLLPGRRYVFSLSVKDFLYDAVESEVEVVVNAPPRPGVFAVTPAGGGMEFVTGTVSSS